MSKISPHSPEESQNQPGAIESRYQHLQTSLSTPLRYIDIASAILLSIATVATAWCAYQSTRWSGVQATAFATASSLRLQSNTAFNIGLTAIDYDTATFIEWFNARSSGDQAQLDNVTNNLIREDFKPYLEKWLSTHSDAEQSANAEDQITPLDDEDYVNELLAPSVTIRDLAESKFKEATAANQTGDDYVLATVLFASVLFFAGVSTKFERLRIQLALVGMGLLMFSLGIVQIAGLPIQ